MPDILYPLRHLHGLLYEEQQKHKVLKTVIAKIRAMPQEVILFVLTPTHGNLGDHAIAEATKDMLQAMNAPYIEITTNELKLLNRYHRMRVMNGYPILVNGGGNLGTLWPAVEKLFRTIIKSAPKSKIICLPNTIYYESSPMGHKELKKSRSIYSRHRSLLLCARENVSYAYMQKNYRNVILVPDMALSLNKCQATQTRNGCLLCLRNDIEKIRTEEETTEILKQARAMFGTHVKQTDMNIQRPVTPADRNAELEKKYAEFRAAELVITDRLHGMIFAAITGTPCIIVDSKSPKVKGCFQWVQELGYLRFAEAPEKISSIYNDIKGNAYVYNNEQLLMYFELLKAHIQGLLPEDNQPGICADSE